LYIENISHYEINIEIDNNLCNSNKQEKIIIQSTNKKNKNKYPEYINSNVKNSENHINENEQYQINEHCDNQVDYMKNLKNHAKKRQAHEQDLENNHAKKRRWYQQDLENNRAKKRRQYEQDLEINRVKRRRRYTRDLENNRAKQLERYQRDLKNNRAKQRERYKQDLENNRIKKRCQYKKNLVKKRAQKQIRYLINSQHEQERQRKLPSDRKWLYNKQYYQKRSSNSIVEKKNYNIVKNITKKYVKFRSRDFIKIRSSSIICVENILQKLNITESNKHYIEKRLQAEKLVRWYTEIIIFVIYTEC